MDAAEHLFATRGYRTTTMEAIAREAGFSRGSLYRQFPTRDELVSALVRRVTQRHTTRILDRLPADADLLSILVESMVMVATELIHDPLLKTISDQTDDRTVAFMLANNPALHEIVQASIEAMMGQEDRGGLRSDLHPKDVATFLIGTNISMLLGVIPGVDNAQTARRYIDVFILPALMADPPPAGEVF
ncbi:TetR/AcrR family transcriptional regulator; helix-turn-helix transcriptional regulator [Mycobacterium sp. SMC-4]|nr:TetR/AcrR family transcriptional regulator; helix-turn-helix transcriptional regulator [Mycobacterium sp. SMC-4]